jgi:hypothetical protein
MSQIRANNEFHETHGIITADGELVTTANPFPVTQVGGAAVSENSTFGLNVARGLVPGITGVFKAGFNSAFANGSQESFWSHSELYPWSSWGAGGTLSCESGSASDTGTLTIVGLNSTTWETQTETITLNGTTPVVTSNSYIRLNNLEYNGANTNVSEIHANRNGVCVGHISAGTGLSQGAQYTVPAGYTAYMMQGTANIGKGNDGTGFFKYRVYGGSFDTALTFLLYQSTFDYTFSVPLPLPEKTDIDVTMIASNSNTPASCAYSMVLIANPEE